MDTVAITGTLACGKTSVCQLFGELGAHVVSADEVVHELLTQDTNLIQQIVELLGEGVQDDEGLDRKKIAEKVFRNPELLERLEGLIHPKVKKEVQRQYDEEQEKKSATLFVVEIPLLFETPTDFKAFYSKSIAVVADEKLCRERFKIATGYDDAEFDRRMARQLSQKEKALKADFIILNNESLSKLRESVQNIYNQLVKATR